MHVWYRVELISNTLLALVSGKLQTHESKWSEQLVCYGNLGVTSLQIRQPSRMETLLKIIATMTSRKLQRRPFT